MREPLSFVGTTDLAGLLRGKAFPTSEWEARSVKGVGWTPTNVMITCFEALGPSPFGALGDLILVPDEATRVKLEAGERPALDLTLGDITSLEGEPWALCTRSILKRALAELEAEGLTLLGAFEHEFMLADVTGGDGEAYSWRGFRAEQALAERLMASLRAAGLGPDTYMKEYGPAQYEVTVEPATGVTVADHAAILRMLTAEAALAEGHRATFSPILDPATVGNGVHVHMSLRDLEGRPATWDKASDTGLSRQARHFVGGILAHLDAILAILAPSDVSYLRLTPHRWSAAFNNLGYRDREAAVRICPVMGESDEQIAKRFNFEVRACDAAASPHLALAALVFAGVQGLRDKTEPPKATHDDLSEWPEARLAKAGMRRLPTTLEAALDRLEASEAVASWFGAEFVAVYGAHKRAELGCLDGLDTAARCKRYAGVY